MTDDQDNRIRLARQHDTVGDREQRRGVDNDMGVAGLESFEQLVHRGRAEHFGREGRDGAAGEDVQIGDFGDALDGIFNR